MRTEGAVLLRQQAAPASPGAGRLALYAVSGGRAYLKDNAGSVKPIGTMNYRGTWDGFTAYALGDVVILNGSTYVATDVAIAAPGTTLVTDAFTGADINPLPLYTNLVGPVMQRQSNHVISTASLSSQLTRVNKDYSAPARRLSVTAKIHTGHADTVELLLGATDVSNISVIAKWDPINSKAQVFKRVAGVETQLGTDMPWTGYTPDTAVLLEVTLAPDGVVELLVAGVSLGTRSGATYDATRTKHGFGGLSFNGITEFDDFNVYTLVSVNTFDLANWDILGPVGIEVCTLAVTGVLTAVAGKSRIYLEGNYVVETVRAAVNTAPTGASIKVDVNKNGTSIYATTQANRPTIAISGFSALGGTPDTTTFAAGDYLQVDVDQIGSTIAGSDLTVTIRLRKVV